VTVAQIYERTHPSQVSQDLNNLGDCYAQPVPYLDRAEGGIPAGVLRKSG